ncbi:MAG: acetyltransferase [Candidatus Magasanikbacteria bacterium]|nr:acetyltransferase [Candidatus Magasanikbacteria bacterium]
MPDKIIIIGAGEQGRLAAAVLRYAPEREIAGFLDDQPGAGVLGRMADFSRWLPTHAFLIALGDNALRRKIFNELLAAGARFGNAIHPRACVEASVQLGVNIFIGALALVNHGSVIGDNTIINSGSIIEHDNRIGSHVHIAPGVITAGGVQVGDGALIGLGATIMEDLTVGENTVIGAHANVLNSMPANVIAYGNPAQIIRSR